MAAAPGAARTRPLAPFVVRRSRSSGRPATLDISGGLAGGQIGANYQAGSWVLGVEADASWADLTGNNACADRHRRGRGELPRQGRRARHLCRPAGFALDRVLFYGKGGAAFANDKYEINSIAAYRANETRWGWMAGAGIEYSFTDNWSAKIEYNYLDFGSRAVRFTDTTGFFALDTSIRERIHVAKVGINYRFGWAPVGVTY